MINYPMNFLRERVYSMIYDRIERLSLFGFFVLCLFSVFNFLEVSSIEWTLRICIYGAGIFLVFLFGHKGTWITWCVSAYVMFQFTQYKNLTCFSIISVLITFFPRFRYLMIGLYVIDVFILCHFRMDQAKILNLSFHFVCCAFVYFATNEVSRRVINTHKHLELKHDEMIILDYLSQGLKQNDIIEFSAQTVSRKMRDAKSRNNIKTTNELVRLYTKQKDEDKNTK